MNVFEAGVSIDNFNPTVFEVKGKKVSKEEKEKRRRWNIERGGGNIDNKEQHPEHWMQRGGVKKSQQREFRRKGMV